MTPDIVIVLTILAVAVVLFVTEWMRADLVAVLVLLTLAISGLLGPAEAVSGFSSPAVLAVCGIFVLSAGLFRSGVAGWLAGWIERLGARSEVRLVLAIMVVSAVLSYFMNTMGIVAILLPAVMDLARRTGLAPSRLLMPLTFGALLGGLTTTFATLPNLLASTALKGAGLKPFGLFDFLPLGATAAVAGIVFMTFIGRRLLPERDLGRESSAGGRVDLRKHYELHERMFVLRVPPGSVLGGKSLSATRLGSALGLHVVGILRDGRTILAPSPDTALCARDRLLVQGTPDQLKEMEGWRQFIIGESDAGLDQWLPEEVEFAEVRLAPGSSFANQTLPWLDVRHHWGVNVAAIRRDFVIRRSNLQEWRLEEGDFLLVQGPRARLEALQHVAGLAEFGPLSREKVAERYDLQSRLFTLRIPSGSQLADRTLAEGRLGEALGVAVLAIEREGRKIVSPGSQEMLRADDCLLVEGRSEDLVVLRGLKDFELETGVAPEFTEFESEHLRLGEVVLSPRTGLVGKTLRQLRFRDRYGLTVLGVWRAGKSITARLGDVALQFGDALLLYGPRDKLHLLGRDPDFIVLTAAAQEPPLAGKAPFALLALVAFLLPVSLGWLPIHLGALLGAALMILLGCLRMDEVYVAIEWKAAVVIAGLLPLGAALQSTGAAALAATELAHHVAAYGPRATLAAVFVMTALGTCVMPGTALVLLLSPIVLHTAAGSGLSPHALMMAMALPASASFLSPVSHPANLLIMGPGGYRFKDFLKVGLPMTIVLFLIVMLVLPLLWPLRLAATP
jgi:di/tricarboxylate transporter